MRLIAIEAETLTIPFRVSFKHVSAERARTQAVWVEVQSEGGIVGTGEGCPREYVTSESIASAHAFIERHRLDWLAHISDLDSLTVWAEQHSQEIDANPAAWSAVEIAMLDCFGRCANVSIESQLDLPRLQHTFRYTAVLGDASQGAFDRQLASYLAAGFADWKIKLSPDVEVNRGKIRSLVAAAVDPTRVRADANNLWDDADHACAELRSLEYPFGAIEEPLQARDLAGMRRLGAALDTRIILDESAVSHSILDAIGCDSARWIVNVRVSKMGGVLRSLEWIRRTRRLGIPVVVGAHVGETSVLTRAALPVAQAAGASLLAQEGAFGTHLLERDVANPPLMFGARGMLDASTLNEAGLGLRLAGRDYQQ